MMHIHSAGNEFLQSLFNSMSEGNSSPADKTVSRKIEFHSAAEKEKQESNGAGKMKLLRMATGTGIVILIIAGVFTYQKADRSFRLPFFLKTGKISPSNPKDTARPVPVSIDSYVHQDSIKNRIKIPPANKKQAESYCDSAALLARDIEKAIRFYSLAVSFNPYNLNAWQGLVLAYRAAYRSQEADETEARMKRLFGKNLFSIRNIVKPYGRLVEYSIDEKGTCRIAYTSSTLVRADLELETFRLLRALAVEKNFPTVVLYAATQKGSGMLVRIQTADFPLTVAEYKEKAMITFIQ
jgi:tetratricopeptide (TPR) repeat protein